MSRKSIYSEVSGTLFVIGIILFSGCIAQGIAIRDYEYLGDKEVTVPNNWSMCQMELDNSVGKIMIKMAEDTADYLVRASIKVSGRNGEGSVEDANTLSYSAITENTVRVAFDSDWKEVVTVNPYTYELTISIRKDISLELVLDVSTGEVDVILEDLTIPGLQLQTSTGDMDVDLNSVLFSDATPEITSSTGQITVSLADLEYQTAQTHWEISSSTGKVDCTIDQTIGDQGVREFDMDVSTGSITADITLPDNYGLKVVAKASTGDVSIFNSDAETYTSPNYDSAAVRYEFALNTSTGAITVT